MNKRKVDLSEPQILWQLLLVVKTHTVNLLICGTNKELYYYYYYYYVLSSSNVTDACEHVFLTRCPHPQASLVREKRLVTEEWMPQEKQPTKRY